MTNTETPATYTEQQATDEAVLLLVRKLRRLHRDAYADLMIKLPQGAQDAIDNAERRADSLRFADQATDITRTYPAPVDEDDDEQD
jgi:hypothetical protein